MLMLCYVNVMLMLCYVMLCQDRFYGSVYKGEPSWLYKTKTEKHRPTC